MDRPLVSAALRSPGVHDTVDLPDPRADPGVRGVALCGDLRLHGGGWSALGTTEWHKARKPVEVWNTCGLRTTQLLTIWGLFNPHLLIRTTNRMQWGRLTSLETRKQLHSYNLKLVTVRSKMSEPPIEILSHKSITQEQTLEFKLLVRRFNESKRKRM